MASNPRTGRRHVRRRRRLASIVGAALTVTLLATAAPADAGSYSPSTTTFVAIGDGTATSTRTDPYPLSLTAEGMGGAITDVDVELPDVYHARPSDLGLLIVSPSGTAVYLKAQSWCEHDLNYQRPHVSWRFSDQAANGMDGGSCPSGWWRPSVADHVARWSLPAPAPAAPYATRLSALNGQDPNGTWHLYAHDGTAGAQGELGQGFRLHITTAATGAIIGGPAGHGPASPYPLTREVSGYDGRLAEVTVTLDGLTHRNPDDLDLLLVGPTGRSVVLMSDACGGGDLNGASLSFSSSVVGAGMPDEGSCAPGVYNPTNHGAGDVFPSPAPPGPYATSLTTFAGTPPNGTWRLYVNDDLSGASGYLTGFRLGIALRLDTTITAHPRASTRNRSATFSFTSNQAGAQFQCQLDSAAWEACGSPRSYTRLAVRRHVFRVRAVTSAGYRDPTPATFVWEVLP